MAVGTSTCCCNCVCFLFCCCLVWFGLILIKLSQKTAEIHGAVGGHGNVHDPCCLQSPCSCL